MTQIYEDKIQEPSSAILRCIYPHKTAKHHFFYWISEDEMLNETGNRAGLVSVVISSGSTYYGSREKTKRKYLWNGPDTNIIKNVFAAYPHAVAGSRMRTSENTVFLEIGR